MFKIGDKVRRIADPYNVQKVGTEFVIKAVKGGKFRHIHIQDPNNRWWDQNNFVLVDNTTTPHKWHDIICAWAKGVKVQFRLQDGDGLWHEWVDVKNPAWFGYGYEIEYRIKPEPKPDFSVDMQLDEYGASPSRLPSNIKATFDGNTGKLKDIKLIK